MRWLGVLAVLLACGGKSGSQRATDPPIANAVPPVPTSSICEDAGGHYPPTNEPGLVIDEGTFLQRAIQQHEIALRNCYLQRLKYRPEIGGKVEIQLTIDEHGSPTKIRTIGFDEQLDRCLCERLAGLTFERLSGGDLTATYPLFFAPSRM